MSAIHVWSEARDKRASVRRDLEPCRVLCASYGRVSARDIVSGTQCGGTRGEIVVRYLSYGVDVLGICDICANGVFIVSWIFDMSLSGNIF